MQLNGIRARDRSGLKEIAIDTLAVRAGKVVGISGISGKGQTELIGFLTGQCPSSAGMVVVEGKPRDVSRGQAQPLAVRYLPEQPLRNACAARISVAWNIAYYSLDQRPESPRFWPDRKAIRAKGEAPIAACKVKTTSPDSPISALSSGNVQRGVLARELTAAVRLCRCQAGPEGVPRLRQRLRLARPHFHCDARMGEARHLPIPGFGGAAPGNA